MLLIDVACLVAAGGSIIWEAGVISNFWNPIGWVSVGMLLVGAACVGYGASQL
jgi:hypothetical protein